MIDKLITFIFSFLFGFFLYHPNINFLDASGANEEENQLAEVDEGVLLTPLGPARKLDIPAIVKYIQSEFLSNKTQNKIIEKVEMISDINHVFKIEIEFFKTTLNELINSSYYYYQQGNEKIYFNKGPVPSRSDTLALDSVHLKEITLNILKSISLDSIKSIIAITKNDKTTGLINLTAEFENSAEGKVSENPQEDLESFFAFKESYPFFPETQERTDNYLYKISRIYSLGIDANSSPPESIDAESYKKILHNMMNFIEVYVDEKYISDPKDPQNVLDGIRMRIFLKQDTFNKNLSQMKMS